ncbi:MAG: hypothetical protein KBS81_09140, partial [Spirochaetales bacterium]|nr:hypothetical protein [Candidatus Physcosoma equi]
LKSEKRDLDLGLGLSVGFSTALEGEFLYGALLDLNLRYMRNFKNGSGFFFGLEYPVFGVIGDYIDSEAKGLLPIIGYPELAILWNIYFGSTIGYRWDL